MMGTWRTENLECVCEILDTLRKPITKRDRTTGKYPYYGATGIVDHVADFIFDEKLVLVGEDGAKWASGEATAFIAEGKYWVNNHAHVLRPDKDIVLHEWLAYYLTHMDLSRFVGGLTVPKLNQGNLKAIPISFPSLSEQKCIVAILNEAFDGIAKATANAQRNLINARELPEALLEKALEPQRNWKETKLANIAEFKNGLNFTRTSKGDTIRIVGVKDFQNEYWVPDTDLENVTIDGKLPPLYELQLGDILTVRSNGNKQLIGRCIIVGDVPKKTSYSGFTIRIRATSTEINPQFLAYALKSKATRARLVESGGGANISSLNQGALSDLPIKFPSLNEQAQIVAKIHSMIDMCKQLQSVREHRLSRLTELRQSLLHKAFTGQLTSSNAVPVVKKLESPLEANARLTAEVIVLAHYRHVMAQRDKTFGHVKEQKILHLVESCANIPLGRSPIKDAAGPNDFAHMLRAEDWAESNGFFKVTERENGYSFQKLKGYDRLLSEAQERLKPFKQRLDKILGLLVPMNSQEAEVFATVHAAWNNLIIDKKSIADDAIVKEARDDWHPDKLKIPREKFLQAIRLIRKERLIPDGSARAVRHLQEKFL